MSEALREVTVNGVRYFQASDVERWHRGVTAKAEEWDELSERVEAAADTLRDIRAILDAYTDDDGPGAALVALGKIGNRLYSEATGV